MTSLRNYQIKACEVAAQRSCIVILPTGAGKTLIAATVAKSVVQTDLTGSQKVLFLVPTRLLVNQQATYIRSETGLKVAEYMGYVATPLDFDIIVSTPAAFLELNDADQRFGLENFQLIIFDEVHHVIKKHPYRTIAKRLASIQHTPRILGLSASLTYAMGAARIENAVIELCHELRMSGNCIFTATTEELSRDGYHAACTTAQVLSEENVDDSPESREGTQSLDIPGQVHESLDDFLRHVSERLPPIHELSLVLMATIASIENALSALDPHFQSPIGQKGKNGSVGAWGALAFERRCAYERQSGEAARAAATLCFQLQHLYEAARLVINTRQRRLELAFQYLIMVGVLHKPAPETALEVQPLLAQLSECWGAYYTKFCGMLHLKTILLRQSARFGDSLRCIIFVQQRVTTHILQHFIENEPGLSFLHSDIIYAASSPATAELSVTATQARDRLNRFATGEINLLIATSVAEEGMDIPAANCVLRFDPVQTPVSLVQSRGRARQEDSAFVVMREDSYRTVADLQVAEQQQHEVIAAINTTGIAADERPYQYKPEAHTNAVRAMEPILHIFEKIEQVRSSMDKLETELTVCESRADLQSDDQGYLQLVSEKENSINILCDTRKELLRTVLDAQGNAIYSALDCEGNVTYFMDKARAVRSTSSPPCSGAVAMHAVDYAVNHQRSASVASVACVPPRAGLFSNTTEPTAWTSEQIQADPLLLVNLPQYLQAKEEVASIMRAFTTNQVYFIGLDNHVISIAEYHQISKCVKAGEDPAKFMKGVSRAFKTGFNKKTHSYTETALFVPAYGAVLGVSVHYVNTSPQGTGV